MILAPSQAERDRAVAAFQRDWGAVDEVLYGLCRDHPGHGDRRAVAAKVVLIGRAYSAGLERQVEVPEGGQAISAIVDHVVAHSGEIDDMLGDLHAVSEPLTAIGMETIVSVHGRFTALLTSATRGGSVPRSFASKYLHFHNPAVPLYDSYALAGLRRRVRWDRSQLPFACPAGGDDVEDGYYQFCVRFWRLVEACRKAGVAVTVKSLDSCLWSVPTTQQLPVPYQPGDEPGQGLYDFGTGHLEQDMWRRPNRELERAFDILMYGITVDGYSYAQELLGKDLFDLIDGLHERCAGEALGKAGFVDLRLWLFFKQRAWHHSDPPLSDDDEVLHALNAAICDAWDREWPTWQRTRDAQ